MARIPLALRHGYRSPDSRPPLYLILTLARRERIGNATIGDLSVNGRFECLTLEDLERPNKIPGETAIPKGTYQILLTMSPRFHRVLPLLVNVPGFDGIRIHPGNTDKDTEGCILVGTGIVNGALTSSRVAFDRLYLKLAQAGENLSISII